MNHTPHHHRLSARLDAEWQALATSRRALRLARTWATTVPTEHASMFTALDDLDTVIDATQRSAGATGNALLLALVELAREHELAGQIVLRRLVPGLFASAARFRSQAQTGDTGDDVIGAAWIALRHYDPARRTPAIAATLISDAIYLAYRRDNRRRVVDEMSMEPVELGERFVCPPPPPLIELADAVRTARHAGVPTHDLDLIRSLVQAGSPSTLARQQRVTARTIRNRRDRAVDNVRSALAIAA